eukprot:GHVU01218028.1.p1 GENE.GHVU01218028.1~~GHVU01218028.1.p1  ORF type:complete len:127 (-),score=21.56 GHVU01218028.1:568-948(-)
MVTSSAAELGSGSSMPQRPLNSFEAHIRQKVPDLDDRLKIWKTLTMQKFINNLLSKVYENKYLATHCAVKAKFGKQAIPKQELEIIIAMTLDHYPDKNRKNIIKAMRFKFNNADKKYKVLKHKFMD